MSKTDDVPNPQAFPRPGFEQCAGMQDGMTLRDWFAGQALAAMDLSRHGVQAQGPLTLAAGESAYAYADAMLRARVGRTGNGQE